MVVVNKSITIQTKGHCDLIDITQEVAVEIKKSEVSSGIITLFVSGSTAAITTIENESGLLTDFKNMWERTVPSGITYAHDQAWGDGNGYSHVRASLLGPSLTIPVVNQKMTLGTWQQIVFVDFDNRPRTRRIIVQIMGE